MRPFRGAVWGCALAAVAAATGPAGAAWDNVFQACCHRCGGSPPAVANYGPGCCDPCQPCCPQQVCTTRYVQRCYYQPVTTYQQRTYYEPVTTYRTSYFYEPVTSYRYSFYRDPCSGCCQQVATPVTSYRLRSQCCPVTSYLQRCCLVPVTSYQQAFYYEPVTQCCQVQCPAPCPTPPCDGAPAVNDRPAAPAPGVRDYPGANGAPQQQQQQQQLYYQGGAGLQRQLPPVTPRLAAPVAPPPPPPGVKLEKIVALPGHNVEGQVVRQDKLPQDGARVLFVCADRQGDQQVVTADAQGQFRATLASGNWLVYVHGADGKPVFHSKIEVKENERLPIRLVSR